MSVVELNEDPDGQIRLASHKFTPAKNDEPDGQTGADVVVFVQLLFIGS